MPPLKLIDFGLATHRPLAIATNVLEVGKNMIWLISRKGSQALQYQHAVYKGIDTMAVEILPGSGTDYPLLDPDLRDLVVRCLAVDPAIRPGLDVLFRTTRDAVMDKDPESFGHNELLETDEEIQRVLQGIMYNSP